MNFQSFGLVRNLGVKPRLLAALCLIAVGLANVVVQADAKKPVETKVSLEKFTVSAENLIDDLRRHPDKSKLKSLTITPSEGERPSLDCLRELANLESLDLTGNRFDEKELRPLEALTKLKELSLNGNDIGTRCVSDSVYKLPNLEVLDLRRTLITNAAFPYIAKIKTLRKLSLGFTKIKRPSTFTREEPFTVLAKLPGLRELELRGLNLAHDDVLSLGEIKSLRTLDLGRYVHSATPNTFVELKRLLPSVPLAQTYLWRHSVDSQVDDQNRLIRVGDCTTRNLKAIVEMGETTELHTVGIVGNSIAIEGHTAISYAARIPSLRRVSVSLGSIKDEDIEYILTLPCLEMLILDGCTVTCSVASWRKLLALKTLKRIENALSDIPEELQDVAGDKLGPVR